MKIKMPEITKATKRKFILLALFVLGVLTMTALGAIKVALWFDSNKLTVKSPLVVTTQRIVTIEPRLEKIISPIVVINYPEEVDTPLEQYICEKWGLMDCKMALAVANAESGLNCDAYNVNTNRTIDLSVFQLNTVHLKKGGDWTLANMSDCYKNVDLAYELWLEQGWSPWVAYLSGAYLKKY